MQCVILPGGVGTRLWPLSDLSLRPILPLANVPFVHYQLSWLAGQGVTQVVYALPDSSPVRRFAGDGAPWGLSIDSSSASPDGPVLHRLRDAGRLDEWFFVLSARSFVPVDFRRMSEAFLGQGRPAMLAVSCNRGLIPVGDVCFSAGLVPLYQKPLRGQPAACGMHYSDAGLSILRREVIDSEEPPPEALADLYQRLSLADQLAGIDVTAGLGAPWQPGG